MIKRNIRIPNNPKNWCPDPFCENPESPDIQLIPISSEHTGNGLSLDAVQSESRALGQIPKSSIERRTAISNFIKKTGETASRVEDSYRSLANKK